MKIQLEKSELNRFWFTAMVVVFSLCLFSVMVFTGYRETINNIIAIVSFIISVYLAYVYRYNIGLFLVMLMILYTNYSITVGVFIDPSIRPESLYYQIENIDTYGKGIVCIFIFEFVLLLMSYNVVKKPQDFDVNDKYFIEQNEYNVVVAYGAIVVYAIMFFSGFNFGLGEGGRAANSALAEYKIIVQIIGMYYSGRKKHLTIFWTLIVGLTTLMTFMGGNRIDAISNIIALILFGYSHFLNYKRIMIALPIGIIVLAGIGYMRIDFSLSLEKLNSTLQILTQDKLTYEGAIIGYVPSLATIEMVEFIPTEEKYQLFLDHIKYIFTFGETVDVQGDLSDYSRNYYLHYWGFISPTYFYFWFKYIGPVLFALLVNVYIKMYVKSTRKVLVNFSEKLMYILSMYFICNVGRWYCYGPMCLFRGAFVCIIVYAIVYFVDNIIRKGKKERS